MWMYENWSMRMKYVGFRHLNMKLTEAFLQILGYILLSKVIQKE